MIKSKEVVFEMRNFVITLYFVVRLFVSFCCIGHLHNCIKNKNKWGTVAYSAILSSLFIINPLLFIFMCQEV